MTQGLANVRLFHLHKFEVSHENSFRKLSKFFRGLKNNYEKTCKNNRVVHFFNTVLKVNSFYRNKVIRHQERKIVDAI